MMQSARLTCEVSGFEERRDGITLYESSLYWCNDGGRAFVGCRLEFDCTSCFRSSFSGYKRAFEICGNGSLQVYNTLQVPEEKERLKQTDILIIGGGAIDEALEAEIKHLPTAVYSTYGMTETLSHIALRRLNGTLASEHYYPFSSVKLSLSVENTLIIDAPLVCDEILQTNDIARIYPDGSFYDFGSERQCDK